MRRLTTVLALIALLAAAGRAQQRGATVQGIVVKAGTTDVLPETAVELSSSAGGAARYTAITDRAGMFSFLDIPAGSYRLAAAQTGYLRSEYGQRGPNGRGLVLALGAGEQLRDARIELTQTGAITGRVLNRKGLPFPHVQIQALRHGYEEGRRVLKTVRSVMTDDRGQYRIFWLPPGSYTLMANPLPGTVSSQILDAMPGGGTATRMVAEPTGEAILSPDDERSPPLFFPGTTTPQAASVVEVRSGVDSRGIDFAFIALPTFRVKGVATGLLPPGNREGLPPPTFLAALTPGTHTEFADDSKPRVMTNLNPVTGAFEFNGVLPGSYDLSASATLMTPRPDGALTSTRVRDRIPIGVAGSDIDNVTLRLTPSWEIRGRLSVEGQTPEASEFRAARLAIRARPGGVYGEAQGATGAFVLRDLRAGDYQLWVEELPPGHYLKSIRLGDVNILDEGLRLASVPDLPIEIVLGTRPGTVSGKALDSRGAPARNVIVALVPDAPRRQRLDLYRNAFTDAAGGFRFEDVAPGGYKVFVWEDVEAGAWQNAEFLAQHETSGKTVPVTESGVARIEVTLP